MAIIKFIDPVHPSKKGDRYGGLKRLISYITKPEKTQTGRRTGYRNVSMMHPDGDMIRTMEHFGKVSDNPHCRLAYHFVVSFKKGDGTTGEQCYEVLDELCRKLIPGYEAVIGVHDDKEHMHGHIAFNATSFETGRKYRYEDGDWEKTIQPMLDEICKKHGCHTLSEDTGIAMEEYARDRKRKGRRKASSDRQRHGHCNYYNEATDKRLPRSAIIRNDIDEAILLSDSFEQFIEIMKERGYTIRHGNVKHMTVRQHDGNQNRRVDTLDKSGYYSEEMIKKRIADHRKPIPQMPVNEEYRFVVPKPYRVIRLPRRELNKYEKQYYAKMYRMGMRKKRHWVSCHEIKKSMEEIRDMNEKLKIMYDAQSDIGRISMLQEQQEAECDACRKELEECAGKQKTYRLIFTAASAMDRLEVHHKAWETGDVTCASQNEEYLKWKAYLQEYGYTKEEAQQAKENLRETKKDIQNRLRQKESRLRLFSEIISELTRQETGKRAYEEQTQEIYNEILTQERQEKERKQQNEQRTRKDRNKGGRA